jgi:VWFA-related protein
MGGRGVFVIMRQTLVIPVVMLLFLTGQPVARQATAPPVQPDRQFPPVTFKVEINYVEVDAVVVDLQGQFVRSLGRDDFQVLEDGKPQTVTTFALVDIPVERAEAPVFVPRAIEPDIQTNARGLDGRLYLIVLDDRHTHFFRTQRVRRAARQFIERNLGANDLAAVVTTYGRAETVQDFTASKPRLLAAVDHFMGNKLRSATANKLDEYYLTRGLPTFDPNAPLKDTDEQQRAYHARLTLETLKRAADFMAGVRGRRKALIFISEGIDYDISDPVSNSYTTDILDVTREAVAAASRANVSFYTIDPRGLTTLGEESIDMPPPPIDNPQSRLGTQSLMDELRLSQSSLQVLADETGGFAALNSNDFTTAFDRIREDNSTYYVLGYYPTNDRRDGRFRKIEVRVNQPGVTVRARRGYVAPRGKAPAASTVDAKEGTSPAVREALESPVPVSGLRMSVFAAPFKGTVPNASVLVVIQADGRDLRLSEKDGRFVDKVEFTIVAIDAQGKTKNGSRRELQLSLKPETRAMVAEAGIRFTDRLDLPPGRYRLRVVAGDTSPGVVGSINYDLDIPSFSAGPISMSGLVLTSSLSGRTPSVNVDEEIARILPGPPTTRREFSAGEELALLAEVYDNQGATPHKVDITTTVQSDDGRVLFNNAEERSSTEFEGTRGGFGYLAKVPLKGMAPGLYVLTVQARSRLGQGATAVREIQFRIR